MYFSSLCLPLFSAPKGKEDYRDECMISQGPILGRLSSTGVRVWARTLRKDPFKKISMLGQLQRNWLINGVINSADDFIFVVSNVNFMVPHIGGRPIS